MAQAPLPQLALVRPLQSLPEPASILLLGAGLAALVPAGGTIFLDEIGEIPLELQTKLLRVLQEREFERLGSSRTLRTVARLIAATNRDLEAMVSEQKFRSYLFFRLNVFPVHVPPLRLPSVTPWI